jgi:hypothetical protein
MDSQTIVDRYEAKLEGQQLLFPDSNIVLRNTKFKKIDPEFDKAAIVHWWMNVYVPEGHGENKTEYEVYNTWSNAVYPYFRNIHISGYNPHTDQQAVTFAGYKKEPVDPQIEELRLWVPHIKPCKDKNDRVGKHVKVFEHTLSENGSWHLWIYSDNEYALGTMRWHRYTQTATFDSLGKSVWFITQHYYYKKKY